MAVELARKQDAIPLIKSAAQRSALSPDLNDRIQYLVTGELLRWDGADWVADSLFGSLVGGALLDKGGAVYNVMHPDVGAKGDGATDDTAAIQTAINAVNTLGGGKVILPKGTYLIATTLNLKANVELVGIGQTSVIKAKANFGDIPLIRNAVNQPPNDESRDNGLRITGLYIDGNKANNATATEFSHCIALESPVDVVVEKCFCINPKGDGVYIGRRSGAGTDVIPERITVRDCTVNGAARQGIAVTEGRHVEVVENYVLSGDLHGIDLEANNASSIHDGIVVSRNIIAGNGGGVQYGIAVNTTGVASGVSVIQNHIMDQAGIGIGFRGCKGLSIAQNVILDPSGAGISTISSSVSADAVSIVGNVIRGAGSNGIALAADPAAEPVLVADNVIIDISAEMGINLTNYVNGAIIKANLIENAASRGIYFTGCQKLLLVGNMCLNCGSSGIGFAENNTYCLLVGNICEGNTAEGINENASVSTNDYNVFIANDCRGNTGSDFVRGAGANNSAYSMIFDFDSPQKRHLSATTTWNPDNVANGAQTTTTITVTGAAIGDVVAVGFSQDLQALQLTGYVSAADTVTVVLQNGTGSPVDLASGTLRADVWKH